ncbi:MAG: GxxExxY protein [Bacteroidales bacterium]|nr:GxxExxY protein [Candidatus Sodaliphilus aphodohippi]
MDDEKIINQIIECAFIVRQALMPGYLEKVYENALSMELREQGLYVEQQKQLDVVYRGQRVGEFVADIVVNDRIIIEIKAVKTINIAHELQVVNYLQTTGYDNGLIINFGSYPKIEIKRKFRTYDSNL